MKNGGVEDILITTIDGRKGFPEAIESVFPRAQIQLCIVHRVCGSLREVAWKERKTVARDRGGEPSRQVSSTSARATGALRVPDPAQEEDLAALDVGRPACQRRASARR